MLAAGLQTVVRPLIQDRALMMGLGLDEALISAFLRTVTIVTTRMMNRTEYQIPTPMKMSGGDNEAQNVAVVTLTENAATNWTRNLMTMLMLIHDETARTFVGRKLSEEQAAMPMPIDAETHRGGILEIRTGVASVRIGGDMMIGRMMTGARAVPGRRVVKIAATPKRHIDLFENEMGWELKWYLFFMAGISENSVASVDGIFHAFYFWGTVLFFLFGCDFFFFRPLLLYFDLPHKSIDRSHGVVEYYANKETLNTSIFGHNRRHTVKWSRLSIDPTRLPWSLDM